MDYGSLPHFCKREGSGSSRHSQNGAENCFSLDHHFHQQLYNYIKQQSLIKEPVRPMKQGSFHVDVPEPAAEGTQIAKTIESEFNKFGNGNGLSDSLDDLKINGDWNHRAWCLAHLQWWILHLCAQSKAAGQGIFALLVLPLQSCDMIGCNGSCSHYLRELHKGYS